nr:LOW QUALITY PROTEIN: PI-PLC X domain-containing protein 2-like [Rhipicephalus microplus]
MTGNCLDYWAVLLEVDDVSGDNAAVVDSSCFRGHPRWMQENCCHFYNLKVDEMFIPGTHDSAMYGLKRDWPVGDFIFTQDQTIAHQLAFGIRSLDLRVGFTDGAFWIFHNKFKAQVSLETVLRQVRTFVETTGEVVILDFHRFTLGFNRHVDPVEERHRTLVQLIMDTLTGAVGTGSCSTARWKTYSVAAVHGRGGVGRRCSSCTTTTTWVPIEFLCPGVIQNWANAQDLEYLVEYLEKNACKKFPGTLSSAQAELTAKFPSQMDTIRQLAEIVNFNVTNLFREHFWNCTNIVTNDYFLGSGTVELAIEANKYRGKLKGGLGRCEHGLQRGLSTNRLRLETAFAKR